MNPHPWMLAIILSLIIWIAIAVCSREDCPHGTQDYQTVDQALRANHAVNWWLIIWVAGGLTLSFILGYLAK